MRLTVRTFIISTLIIAAGAGAAEAQAPATPAGTVLQQNSEYRFQLDFHVNDAVLAGMLPTGWVSNAATTGAAKDANLRIIFIDEANIVGPDNRVLGKGNNQLVYLAAPVKQAAGPASGQMILSGIAAETATPDGFGVYLKATSAAVTRDVSAHNGAVMVTEDWDFAAGSGELIHMHVKYVRGPANKAVGQANFYNPADPAKYQIFRTEQATDITRNVTTNPPDRVLEFSYHASGGQLAALFDGSEKVLSWDSQPVYARTVITPAP
jgi:hypothetical protein